MWAVVGRLSLAGAAIAVIERWHRISEVPASAAIVAGRRDAQGSGRAAVQATNDTVAGATFIRRDDFAREKTCPTLDASVRDTC